MYTTAQTSEDSFIDLAGKTAEMFSFNRSIGQIYGCLYMSSDPLSLDEIAKRCHMSKGNASVHLRTLESWGAAHSTSKLGNRKDYYYAEGDLVELTARRLEEGMIKRLTFLRSKLEAIKKDDALKENSPESIHWVKRLGEVESLVGKIEKVLPYFIKLKKISGIL